MRRDEAIAYVWESGSVGARLLRGLLWPLGWLFGQIVELRNAAFDRGFFAAHELSLPSISVGNLSVGGTGKTPVAAWLVGRLKAAGARPAIVLRGYGGDEPLVHARLNPGVPVIVNADRVAGVDEARAAGANVVVLDDAFQHRRARRDVDTVLLSADRFGPVRPLPAGPWREPLGSLARASLIAVTRKSASPVRARELLSHALRFAPQAAGAILYLSPDALVQWDSGITEPVTTLFGAPILAVSAIGDPRAFVAQLRVAGAQVEAVSYPDHHAFTAADAESLAARAQGKRRVVCTLKDAVKLAVVWPRQAAPIWYLSQRVTVEAGGESWDRLVASIASQAMSVRPNGTTTPAESGPTTDNNAS
jgi:tetraacyldisaccharide 4'-kinase